MYTQLQKDASLRQQLADAQLSVALLQVDAAVKTRVSVAWLSGHLWRVGMHRFGAFMKGCVVGSWQYVGTFPSPWIHLKLLGS